MVQSEGKNSKMSTQDPSTHGFINLANSDTDTMETDEFNREQQRFQVIKPSVKNYVSNVPGKHEEGDMRPVVPRSQKDVIDYWERKGLYRVWLGGIQRSLVEHYAK